MASKNNSNEFGRFQDVAEKFITQVRKSQEEAKKKADELSEYEKNQAEIKCLEELGRVKEWIRYVVKNAKENESFEEADKRLRRELEAKEVARIMQLSYPFTLPQCSEEKRALPNGMLRSALFGAIRKGRRKFLNEVELAAINGIQIIYKGEQLDQSDLDVYESVLHALRFHVMGGACRLTTYSLLKIMGKKNTGGNIKVLHSSLVRLRANAVVIKQGRYTYIGGLLDEAFKHEITKELVIVLNPKLRLLFEKDQFTLIDWEIRKKLSGQSLAQWLHCFYASHAKPFPIKIETLRELCGSETEELRFFKAKLRKALDAVVKAFKEAGQVFSYEIKDNTVHVRKQPNKSQQRHLQRRKRNPQLSLKE